MTKQEHQKAKEKAEKLGWTFSHLDTTVEKGREIYMMPSKEMALKIVEKREGESL